MTLTAQQTKLDELYRKNFGENRGASFGTLGGADYWLDTHNPQTEADWSEIDRMLAGSQEGKQYAETQKVRPGAINPALSMSENAAQGNVWANHFTPGGVFAPTKKDGTVNDLSNTIWAGKGAGEDGNLGTSQSYAALNNIAKDIGFEVPNLGKEYYDQGINAQLFDDNALPIDNHEIALTTGDDGTTISSGLLDDIAAAASTGDTNTGTGSSDTDDGRPGIDIGNDGWWNQFEDADAFKEFLQGDAKEETKSEGGMDDFMKFMMLMSVMRPGGGGGFGGSQYGYGGLNPGGVQSAYNPWDNLQTGWNFMKDAFGGGSTLNATGA